MIKSTIVNCCTVNGLSTENVRIGGSIVPELVCEALSKGGEITARALGSSKSNTVTESGEIIGGFGEGSVDVTNKSVVLSCRVTIIGGDV